MKSCEEKVRYYSIKGAHKAADELSRKRNIKHIAYKCLTCPHFHVTTKVRKKWLSA